jgi:hypothetical protein
MMFIKCIVNISLCGNHLTTCAHVEKAKRTNKKKMDFNFNESTNNSKSIYEGCLFVCDIEILQNHDAPLCTFATIGYPLMIKGSLNLVS